MDGVSPFHHISHCVKETSLRLRRYYTEEQAQRVISPQHYKLSSGLCVCVFFSDRMWYNLLSNCLPALLYSSQLSGHSAVFRQNVHTVAENTLQSCTKVQF